MLLQPYKGKWPRIHPEAYIAETAVLIGEVHVAAGASIWYGCVLRGDVAPIYIGEESNIQDGTVIHTASEALNGEAWPTRIGNRVTVGHMALLHACTVEDESFVGMKACVMDKAVIASRGMVAAGALIAPSKQVQSDSLWAGVPGRFVRTLSESEQTFFTHSAAQYHKLAKESLVSGVLAAERMGTSR